MKPSKIYDILDLSQRARTKGFKFNPLFVGPPGIGKSEIVQQWCNENHLPFIDLRAAYLEAPDMIGFPSIETRTDANGVVRSVTSHNIPEFWPQDSAWKGVILLEEPNRGTTSVMNTFMQLLTDRKIHKYELPKGALIVGCINPEGQDYDVNLMDAALKDRFEIFEVNYDKQSFIQYMRDNDWDQSIIMFVESNTFEYKEPQDLGNVAGAKYVSPRTFSKLNAAIQSGVEADDEMLVFETILGKLQGKAFLHFKNNEQPVVYSDLVNNPGAAIAKLKSFADSKNYKAGHIAITIRDIVDQAKISDDLLIDVVLALPADQGPTLVRDLEFKRNEPFHSIMDRICEAEPKVLKYLRNVLKNPVVKEVKA